MNDRSLDRGWLHKWRNNNYRKQILSVLKKSNCCGRDLRKDKFQKVGFPGGSDSKESACNAGDLSSIPRREDPLEKGMATHPSIVAWRIPWMKEPGELQSRGSQRVGHDWATNTFTFRGSSEGNPWGQRCFRLPRVITRIQGPARGWRCETLDGGVSKAGQGEAAAVCHRAPCLEWLQVCERRMTRSEIYFFPQRSYGTSLVVQWLRLHFPMQGVQVQSLVRELRSPPNSWPKIQTINNRSNIINNSIKT